MYDEHGGFHRFQGRYRRNTTFISCVLNHWMSNKAAKSLQNALCVGRDTSIHPSRVLTARCNHHGNNNQQIWRCPHFHSPHIPARTTAYFIACPITSHLGKITSSLVSFPPLFFNITPLLCPLLIFLPVFPSLHLLLLLHLHHTHVTHVTHTSRISKYLSESHSQISRSRPGCNNILYNDENIPLTQSSLLV